ncbi:hypothetical protein AB5N19_12708 [Seiridium cardinale]|uniref:Uncharacterized protein n=1 Tax=Seiridium cardinale TaxID=138064 RepID=A0ABR2Y0V9_9PEZI
MSDTDAFELTGTARRSAIVAEIWGSSSRLEAEQNRVAMLDSFFQCYQDEQESEEIDHTEVLGAIRILKRRPETKRVDLQSSDRASAASEETTDVFMLDLAVRSMFLTACTHRTHHGTDSLSIQTVFRPRWKDSESLTA